MVPRYARPRMTAIWEPENKFRIWFEIEAHALDAMAELGTVPREAAAKVREWWAAKRVAAEILSGQSADPTGGALFYHTAAVSPRWSAGLTPVSVIGGHLFFRTAR